MKCILYLQVNQFLELDKQHSEAPQRLFRIVTMAVAATIPVFIFESTEPFSCMVHRNECGINAEGVTESAVLVTWRLRCTWAHGSSQAG